MQLQTASPASPVRPQPIPENLLHARVERQENANWCADTYTYTHTCIPTYLPTCLPTYVHVRIYLYTCKHMYNHSCTCMYLYMYAYVCMGQYGYMQSCVYVFMYMHAYIEAKCESPKHSQHIDLNHRFGAVLESIPAGAWPLRS